jgi:sugar phosphate isomerase/epimerase
MIKVGVNSVLFGKYDFRTAMKHIKWAGYDVAEISAIKGMCEHLCLDSWKRDAADIKAIVEDLQLPLTAMEEAGLDEDRLMMAYEAGASIGIPVINVGPGGSQNNPGDLPKSIDTLAKMAEKASKTWGQLDMVTATTSSTPTPSPFRALPRRPALSRISTLVISRPSNIKAVTSPSLS